MIFRRLTNSLFYYQSLQNTTRVPQRNVQISVVGAANGIGSNLVLLLKQNPKINHLKLYDDDERVKGIAMELDYLPGGPSVTAYHSSENLGNAIQSSDVIVMVSRISRKPGNTREEMIASNAPAVQQLCRAMVNQNPDAFLAISTNPINSIIPFASGVLYKYKCYNPFKIFGITHIDTARSRAFAANALQVNPLHIEVPVIGGHSDESILPLFSNLTPTFYSVDPNQADMLTRLVRKSGTEVLLQKQGTESSTLAMAWSIHEFVDGLIDAICGYDMVLNCFTANPHFGTRFFSGPTHVGCYGISQTCCDFPMSEYETQALSVATSAINKDVSIGEEYINRINAKY